MLPSFHGGHVRVARTTMQRCHTCRFVYASLISHIGTQLIFVERYEAVSAYFHKPRHSFFNVSGYVVYSQPGGACDTMDEYSKKSNMSVADNIVFIESGMRVRVRAKDHSGYGR